MVIFRYNLIALMNRLKSILGINNTAVYRLAGCLLLGFSFIQTLFASNDELKVKSKITSVTVYNGQAQVTRKAEVSVQKGISNLIINEISPYINMNSIQVLTESSVNLLSVSQRASTDLNPIKPEYIITIEDSLESIADLLMQIKIKKDGLLAEKEVMLANKHAGGTAAVLHADDLEETMALFRKRTQEIGEEIYKLTKNEKPLLATQTSFKKQLEEYKNRNANQIELIITLQADESTSSKIEFSYLVSNCSWTPFYDIRVKDTHSPLQLISKANINQNTGEDWNNVNLRLSTSNPNENGTKPELNPNHINILEPVKLESKAKMNMPMADGAAPAMMAMGYASNAVIVQIDTHLEFAVLLPYSIPSDNNAHAVDLTTTEFPASYGYGSVPKLEESVFATVLIPATDIANQLPGNANIYFNGTYTGQTYIQGTTEDSLLLSLGKDARIHIARTLQKELSKKACFGNTKTDLKNWKIEAKNTRKESITILIEDQIPVSDNAEIEVKLLESSGANYDPTTGKLTWKVTIEPEKSASVTFSFEVKYPKNKMISSY